MTASNARRTAVSALVQAVDQRSKERAHGAERSTSRAAASAGSPASLRQLSMRGKMRTATWSRFRPAMTASWTKGAPSVVTRARSGPTLTNVPVDSLKSSANPPSKMNPRCGLSGSRGFSASPVR